MTETIDIAGLVEDGILDLDDVFRLAEWDREGDCIATFTARCFGANGDSPGLVEVAIESATAYGITAYRWTEIDGSDDGPIVLDRDDAVRGGEGYAAENDDEPDTDALIEQIVDTGYFGDADADDIRAVCRAATEYSQGYLLLAAGEIVRPIGCTWTTNGYLQCDRYVTLDATYPSIAYAAHALLQAVETE